MLAGLMQSRPFRVSLVVAAVTALACEILSRALIHQVGRAAQAAHDGISGVTFGDVMRLSERAALVGWAGIVAPCLIVLVGLGLTWATRPIRDRVL